MAENLKLGAQQREETGSGAAARMRRGGVLPGIVNGVDGKSIPIKLDMHELELMLLHHMSENLIVDLDVEGVGSKKVLLKEVQHDSVSGGLLHADFLEISMLKKMRVSIPIELTGESDGVENEGGVLEHLIREVEVECLPTDLVDTFEVDISKLTIGDSLTVGDITWNPAWTILTPENVALATVAAPRVEEEAEVEGGEAEEGEDGAAEGGADGDKGGEEQKDTEA